jgi:hypothetical protein
MDLETGGVLFRSTYVLVHERHAVIRVLMYNADVLGVDIANAPKEHGEWYKLAPSCFFGVCDFLRSIQCEPPPCGQVG